MSDPFIGQIMQIGWNWAPEGWALCNGAFLPSSQNQALYALIGSTYGGDNHGNFQVPNMQSRVVIGTGQYTPGETGGMATVTLTPAQLPAHGHPAQFTPVGPPYTVTGNLQALSGVNGNNLESDPSPGAMLANPVDSFTGNAINIYAPAGTAGTAVNLDGLSIKAQGGITGGTVAVNANTPNGQPVPILPPFIAITSVIALSGIYPQRQI